MSKLSPLKAKLALRAEKDAKIMEVLHKNKSRERAKFTGYSKRKDVSVLSDYISISTDSRFALRSPNTFVTRSYNLSKQIIEFVDHVFVNYQPPLFLYPAILNKAGKRVVFDKRPSVGSDVEKLQRKWFLGIALGQSFAKMPGHQLTKKECHWFLQAPSGNAVADNLTWARARSAGMCEAASEFFVRKHSQLALDRIGDRLPDVLRFYAQFWGSMRPDDRHQLSDYIRAAHYNESFSMKGRTLGSIRKLANEWHLAQYGANRGPYRSWAPTFDFWDHEIKGGYVRLIELTNNRALADEARRQSHCVYSYLGNCLSGSTAILSMRWFERCGDFAAREMGRVTIEVSRLKGSVEQVSGKHNRLPTNEETVLVRRWAEKRDLSIGTYAM